VGPRVVTKLIVGAVLLVAVYVLADYTKEHSPNAGDAKLKEVDELLSSIPTYPDFQEVYNSWSSKDLLALRGRHYRSVAPYEEVRRFYSDHLVERDWHLSEERNLRGWWKDTGGRILTFRQGEYKFTIEYRGDKESDPDWNYAVDLSWHR